MELADIFISLAQQFELLFQLLILLCGLISEPLFSFLERIVLDAKLFKIISELLLLFFMFIYDLILSLELLFGFEDLSF